MIVPIPVGKYVTLDGILLSSSASAITTFDSATPFGCERKSWFEVRAGLKGAPTKSLELGDQIHKQIEHYLTQGINALGKEALHGKGIIDELKAAYPVFQIERWIESFEVEGVKIRGKVDFTGRVAGDPLIKTIVDWKTSSDIQKYGKTSAMLRKDTQMLLYRAAAETEGCEETLPMYHVYFGTQKRESELVRTTINRQQLADGLGDIKEKLSRMKDVMKIIDSEEVTPDRSKCERCPYQAHCIPKGFSFMSSLTDRFKKTAVPAPDPTPVVPEPSVTAPSARRMADIDTLSQIPGERLFQVMEMIGKGELTQEAGNKLLEGFSPKGTIKPSVLPPDAPKSDPAKAALPVEGFSPVPAPLATPDSEPLAPVLEEKRKPGRPKKLSILPQTTSAPADSVEQTNTTPKAEVLSNSAQPDFEVTEITVTVGATVKAIPGDPKCFEFLRVDVTMRATVRKGADIQAVRAKLGDLADMGVVAELEKDKKK